MKWRKLQNQIIVASKSYGKLHGFPDWKNLTSQKMTILQVRNLMQLPLES